MLNYRPDLCSLIQIKLIYDATRCKQWIASTTKRQYEHPSEAEPTYPLCRRSCQLMLGTGRRFWLQEGQVSTTLNLIEVKI